MASGCASEKTPTAPGAGNWRVIAPSHWIGNRPLPVALIDPDQNPFFARRSSFSVTGEGVFGVVGGKMKAGVATLSIPVALDSSKLSLEFSKSGTVEAARTIGVVLPTRIVHLAGTLNGQDLTWDSSQVVVIESDVTIPSGAILRIGPGTIVLLKPLANLDVRGGEIEIDGDSLAPVIFAPDVTGQPWGGIYLNDATASIDYTFLVGGGGDISREFGHSNSQAVIAGDISDVRANRLFIFDCVGKAFGVSQSILTLSGCVVQRCDTGGELAGCHLTATGCYWLDMPSDDGVEVDDDNDGIYLLGALSPTDTSRLQDCIFIEGKDDGVDHNGSLVVLSNCLMDGFDNEGVAASNTRYIRVENCLIQNCEQGVEAGYGSPTVEVNHSTVRNCDTGLRFGDWYREGCSGSLTAANTISTVNRLHNVWNFDFATNGPIPGAINIRFSMVNDSAFDGRQNCIGGTPTLTEEGTLASGSAGISAGSDGKDLGRLRK